MTDELRVEKFLELFNKSRDFTEELLRANERLRSRLGALQEDYKYYATRYTEIEVQNANLASLYVASYQLHSTLDFREVIQSVKIECGVELIARDVEAGEVRVLLLDL